MQLLIQAKVEKISEHVTKTFADAVSQHQYY